MALSTAQRNFSQKQLGTELQKNECSYIDTILYICYALFSLFYLCVLFLNEKHFWDTNLYVAFEFILQLLYIFVG